LSQNTSRIYYPSNLDQLQWALNYQTAQPTDTMLEQLGEGIGNNAAHEIAHQLVTAFGASGKIVNLMDLDNDSLDTYNGGSCADPAVFTGIGADGKTPIHWDNNAATSLMNLFGPHP